MSRLSESTDKKKYILFLSTVVLLIPLQMQFFNKILIKNVCLGYILASGK